VVLNRRQTNLSEENTSLSELSLCLSRACLGKKIVLRIVKRCKRCVFLPVRVIVVRIQLPCMPPQEHVNTLFNVSLLRSKRFLAKTGSGLTHDVKQRETVLRKRECVCVSYRSGRTPTICSRRTCNPGTARVRSRKNSWLCWHRGARPPRACRTASCKQADLL
jgi:hypothetical protein